MSPSTGFEQASETINVMSFLTWTDAFTKHGLDAYGLSFSILFPLFFFFSLTIGLLGLGHFHNDIPLHSRLVGLHKLLICFWPEAPRFHDL